MTGTINGVVQQLRGDSPCVVGVHCMNHRLELCFKDVALKNIYQKKMDQFLLELYLFYHKSPLNRANLERSFKACDLPLLIPTRVGGTRWMSHTQLALDHFLRGYKAVIQHLEQIQSPDASGVRDVERQKAKNLYKTAKTLTFIKYGCFMHDVLYHLCKLSTKLQTSDMVVAEVHESLERTRLVLNELKESTVPEEGCMLSKVEDGMFDGISLTGDETGFETWRVKLLEGFQAALSQRFQMWMKAFFKQHLLPPSRSGQTSADFGTEEVQTLTTFFKPVLNATGVDTSKIQMEWTCLKKSFYKNKDWSKRLETTSWLQMNREFGEDSTNFLSLIDLILTLPVSTAECERGFSAMNLIKTDWRSCLKPETLSDLMTVLLHSPQIADFDPIPAINKWHISGKGQKKPTYTRKCPTDEDEEILSDSDGEENQSLTLTMQQLSDKLNEPFTTSDASE